MNLNNGTSDPVDYDQTGGGTLPEDAASPPGDSGSSRVGSIQADQDTGDFVPAGKPPYTVSFVNQNTRSQRATSCAFSDGSATVTLNADWTITVSTGCD